MGRRSLVITFLLAGPVVHPILAPLPTASALVNRGRLPLHAPPGVRQSSSSADGDAAALIDRFLSVYAPLTRYRAFRTLEATTRGGRMHARLKAWTSLDPVLGFQYSIVDEEGSGIIRRKVLRAALEEERLVRAGGEISRGELTGANYEFATSGASEDGLLRIAIHPKRRDTMLLEGSILVTEDRADLVRIEGLMVRRPSIWTRRVEIVRRYARIGGNRVPISTESTADVLLVGPSTFSMTYEYESINGEPVLYKSFTSGR